MQKWLKKMEIAESNDPDMIEYGVERLGDLVKTDYFEKNAQDGIFSDTAKTDKIPIDSITAKHRDAR